MSETADVITEHKENSKPSFLLIQVLRGVAALLVVAHHSTIMAVERLGWPGRSWERGAAGVDIFFVISGFVMALSAESLAGRAGAAWTFAKRRLERVVPMYWLATSLKLAILLVFPGMGVNEIGGLWHAVASYLFLPSYNALHVIHPVLVVGWTLNFEMFFYTIFAVSLASSKRPLIPLTIALIGIAAASWWVHPPPAILQVVDPLVLEFAAGILLYRVYKVGIMLHDMVAWCWLLGGVLLLFWNPWYPPVFGRPIAWGIPALMIVASVVGLERRYGKRSPKWLRSIGDASYSIYLAHTFMLPLAAVGLGAVHVQGRYAIIPAVLAGVVFSMVAGLAVYLYVERPIIRYFLASRIAQGNV